MSSHVNTLVLTRTLGLVDLICSSIMLLYPALFAELVYPQLTPHGIILAIKLLGWWHFGRGLCVLSSLHSEHKYITGWLWLASTPLHCAALYLSTLNLYTAGWHLTQLILATFAIRISIGSR